MDTKTYDADRLFTKEDGQTCNSCPSCSCPEGKVNGDEWYKEYQGYYQLAYNQAICSRCQCNDDGDGILYASCDYLFSYAIGSQSCPPAANEMYSCHKDYGSSGINS